MSGGLHTERLPPDTLSDVSLRNHGGETIVGRYWTGAEHAPVAVLVHGLGSSMRHGQIEATFDLLRSSGFAVLAYDATNAFGLSEGDIARATLSAHKADLEDVIGHMAAELRGRGPLLPCGFSLGASASYLYASEHPDRVAGLILVAPVVSGGEWLKAFEAVRPDDLDELTRSGSFPKHDTHTGRSGRIGAGFVEDLLRYDLTDLAGLIACPVRLMVGEDDRTVPPATVARLAQALGRRSRLTEIAQLGHTAGSPQELARLRTSLAEALTDWVGG